MLTFFVPYRMSQLTLYVHTYHSMYEQWFHLRISILLAFMFKELSRHASCDIYCNQLEFSNYNLVYYMLIIWRYYILPRILKVC